MAQALCAIIFYMEGVDALLQRYLELLDDVINAISRSDLDCVSKYVLVLQDVITLIAQELEKHPEEKHKHADTVKVIHEKQQKIISLLELQAQDLLREVEETTNAYQARKAYEQNKGIR